MRISVTGTTHRKMPNEIKPGQVFLNTKGGLLVCFAVEDGSVKLFKLREDYQITNIYSYCERYVKESHWKYVGNCEIPELVVHLF